MKRAGSPLPGRRTVRTEIHRGRRRRYGLDLQNGRRRLRLLPRSLESLRPRPAGRRLRQARLSCRHAEHTGDRRPGRLRAGSGRLHRSLHDRLRWLHPCGQRPLEPGKRSGGSGDPLRGTTQKDRPLRHQKGGGRRPARSHPERHPFCRRERLRRPRDRRRP